MTDDSLAAVFESERHTLTGLAYRLLGSRPAAEDVVQDAWLRLTGADASAIDNLRGWLRTVITRLCLDQLRARAVAPSTPGSEILARHLDAGATAPDPQAAIELADEVSRAMLVVLSRLTPVERVALVLHDMFAIRYAEIAPLVDKSAEATKKLVLRARSKVRGVPTLPTDRLAEHRKVVTQFLEAAREGDLDQVMAVLAPDVVRTADASAVPPGTPTVLRGRRDVADGVVALAERSRQAELVLIDGDIGLITAHEGRLVFAVTFTIEAHSIVRYRAMADPATLAQLSITLAPMPQT